MMNAYFAGGCFWCITPIFKSITGVQEVISGYSGGKEENPNYEDVKAQQTGHRETIQITYDESKVSFEKLLNIFLANVDPYDGQGQFIDKGFSYTLAIFYNNQEEYNLSSRKIHQLETKSNKKVHIALEPFSTFYKAEDYHQDYYLKNPEEFELELVQSGRKKILDD